MIKNVSKFVYDSYNNNNNSKLFDKLLIITNYDPKNNNILLTQNNIKNKSKIRQAKIYEKLNKLINKNKIKITAPNNYYNYDFSKIHSENYIDFLKKCYETFNSSNEKDKTKYLNDTEGIIPIFFNRYYDNYSYYLLPFWKQIGFFCIDTKSPI